MLSLSEDITILKVENFSQLPIVNHVIMVCSLKNLQIVTTLCWTNNREVVNETVPIMIYEVLCILSSYLLNYIPL